MDPIASLVQLISEGLGPKEPTSSGPLTLVPLFGGMPSKEYVLGADAFADGSLTIAEVDRGGDVTHLEAHNKGHSPVLLIDGEHLEGAKQNRILNASVLIAGNRTTILPVACVEAGRWRYEARDDFSPSEDFAYGRLRSRNAATRAVSARSHGDRGVDQGEVWADIDLKHHETGAFSASGAMRDSYEHRRQELDVIKDAFAEPAPGQTGVIAFVSGRPIALDAFDRPETLTKLWPRLLSGYALDALGASPAQAAEGAMDAFLEQASRATTTLHEGLGLGTDVVLTAPTVVGNALTWEEGIVHLALFPTAEDGSHSATRTARIEAPSRRARRRR